MKNPNIDFPGTSWKYIGENKTIRLAKQDGSDVLSTGGTDNLTLTTDNMPTHHHDFSARTDTFDYGNKNTNNVAGHVHQYTSVFRYNDVHDDGGGHGLYKTQTENTTHSGDHVHTTYLGPHSHAFAGITKNTGKGTPVNIVNSFIKLMAWYRIS
ncbi:phage baseplate protein [Candidatus Sodalis endolongispinus]|uniref:phage baseplate protein n=1 Tax=Candidatus Sodalis endolongispinus TaxID=2812662 RepID=UPI0035E41325